METATPTKSSLSATPEDLYEDWKNRFLIAQGKRFGSLPLRNFFGSIGECCGNIHLRAGNGFSTPDSYRISATEKPFAAVLKDAEQQLNKADSSDTMICNAYRLLDQVGIYSGEFMDAKSLKETVGLAEDSPCIELVDEDGSIHSLAWKDA